MSRYEISKLSGVAQAALSRFMHGKMSLTLETADKLARVLSLRMVTIKKAKVKP